MTIFTPTIRLTEPVVGGDTGTWGGEINNDLSYIDRATNQQVTVSIADTNISLLADGSTSDQARYLVYNFTGALTANRTVTLPANQKVGWAANNTTGGHNVILSAGGATLTLTSGGSWTFFYCDGSNVISPIGGFASGVYIANQFHADFSGGAGSAWIGADVSNNLFLNSGSNQAILSSSLFKLGLGYAARSGTAGGYRTNAINIDWNGSAAALYVDNTNLGNIQTTSDRRVKQNIKPFTASGLDAVMQLSPITYRFADVGIFRDDGVERLGFVTQEVERVIPSAVNGDGEAFHDDGTPQVQTLNAIPLIATMAKAIQELTERLEALEAR